MNMNASHPDITLLRERFPDKCEISVSPQGEVFVEVKRENIVEVARALKDAGYDYLADVTGADYSKHSSYKEGESARFAVLYNLYSIEKNRRIFLRVRIPESDAKTESLTGVWRGANWLEREVYDLMGIEFKGHPDLRRIMMWDEFEGHPLRKDFPWRDKEFESYADK